MFGAEKKEYNLAPFLERDKHMTNKSESIDAASFCPTMRLNLTTVTED